MGFFALNVSSAQTKVQIGKKWCKINAFALLSFVRREFVIAWIPLSGKVLRCTKIYMSNLMLMQQAQVGALQAAGVLNRKTALN